MAPVTIRATDVVALPMGEFTFAPDWPYPYAGQTGVVVAYAVRHPGGVFLFDTGFAAAAPDLVEFYARWAVRPRDLAEVLGEAGIGIGDVTALANCHLHLDHAGQNDRFPGIPIHVQRLEWAAAHEPDYTFLETIDFAGASYEQLEGDHEVAPGIRLVPTPGHSPGHQSLVIDAAGGPLLLVGQAVYSHGEWIGLDDAREGASSAADGQAYASSVARLRALNPKRVLFGHDRRGWPS
ncbi:MAG: N-acyl homoserine lactonase family protein [Chloroflexota bacterium]|nr:MAG: N-acyl homoserine lactonase family protein [Chloroflexota bacterium]